MTLKEHWSCSMQQKENAKKNTKHSRNKTILKIGHLAKAIAHAKWSLLQVQNAKKMPKIVLQEHKSQSVQKNCSTKHQSFDKLDGFENRPSCKGYSPCKMISLGQKLVMQKTCEK